MSAPVWLLKYAMQAAVLKGQISLHTEVITVGRRVKVNRRRFFSRLELEPAAACTHVERFFIQLYGGKKELTPEELQDRVSLTLGQDIDRFKQDVVYPDLKRLGYCKARFIVTREGKEIRKKYADLLALVNDQTGQLLKNPAVLSAYLAELGPVFLLLAPETLECLSENLRGVDGSDPHYGSVIRFTGSFDPDGFGSFAAFGEFPGIETDGVNLSSE